MSIYNAVEEVTEITKLWKKWKISTVSVAFENKQAKLNELSLIN